MDLPELIPLQQSPRYAAASRLMGRRVVPIMPNGGPPLIAVTRKIGPMPTLLLPRADLSGDRGGHIRALPRHMARVVIPDSDDGIPPESLPGYRILPPQHIAELDLPEAPVMDHLWANMHSTWRNRLRRAQSSAIEVADTSYDPQRDAALLLPRLPDAQLRWCRNDCPAFLAAYAQANPHQTCVLQARMEGDTIAFMVFLLHGAVATYVTGWTNPEGRRMHAHHLLMFEAMRRFFAKGICRIDLGPFDPKRGTGLSRFKLGCGARARTLGAVRLIPPGFRVSP